LRYPARIVLFGTLASVASALAAAACSRVENRHAARPINAVAHIYDGGRPPRGEGPGGRNIALGFGIHTLASVWWALFYDKLRRPAAVAALAYVVDYHVVHRRFRPGFEAHLSAASLFAVYAALAGGFALGSRLERWLDHHEEENAHKGDERRPAERRPPRVVAPEERR
jgi:hypothetical protein